MIEASGVTRADANARTRRVRHSAAAAAIIVGVLARMTVLTWSDPWTPHHPDEHIPALEAMALWKGVTPREVGSARVHDTTEC